MRKSLKVFLFAFVCIFTLAGAKQVAFADLVSLNATNFPDEKFRDAIYDSLDGCYEVDEEGNITFNTEDLTNLRVLNPGCKSLAGIEKLNALTDLKVYSAKVSSINLSHNTNLDWVSIEAVNKDVSINLTGLTNLGCIIINNENIKNLDLSTCSALIDVDLNAKAISGVKWPENNNISMLHYTDKTAKTIDLSKATKTSFLAVTAPKLTKLILPKSTVLSYLCVNSDSLKTIDLSKNKSLEYLDLVLPKSTNINTAALPKLVSVYLAVGDKKLDFSKNTKLQSIVVSKSNNLENINVTKNKALNDLSIVRCPKLKSINLKNNTALCYLDIDNVPLTSVDVSKNKKLETFCVVDCKLKSVNLKNNKKLYSICVNGNKSLSKIDVSKNTELSKLNIGYTNISKLDVSKNKDLYNLRVYYTKISSLNLKKNTKLARISYNGSKIKTLKLYQAKNLNWLDVTYVDIKKGATVDINAVVPKGCKVEYSSDGLKYNAKTGKITTNKKAKDNYAYITLSKGGKEYSIGIEYKNK